MKVKEESEKASLKPNIQKTKIMTSVPVTSWQIDGKSGRLYFGGAPKSLQMVTAAMKLKDTCSLEDFPGGSEGKVSVYNAGDPGSIHVSGRSPGEGNGNPLQYSCLENLMDGRAW